MKDRIIVTGANGFLGSYLISELIGRGYEVYAVVRKNAAELRLLKEIVEEIKIIECDLQNIIELPELLKNKTFKIFFHFAWIGTSGELRNDYEKQLANAKYSCDAMKAAKQLQCKRFIYAGSIMEYEAVLNINGMNQQIPTSYFYSVGKLTADYICKILAAEVGIEYFTVLISNIYGRGEKAPRFINDTLRKIICGERLSFSTGEQLYDFIYVTDAAAAIAEVAEKGSGNSEYYIGNPNPRKLKNYILDLVETVAPFYETNMGEVKSNYVSLSYKEFDTQRIYKEFDFKPEIDFPMGIKLTYDYLYEKINQEYGGAFK